MPCLSSRITPVSSRTCDSSTIFPYIFFPSHSQIYSDIHTFVQGTWTECLPCVGAGTWIAIKLQSLTTLQEVPVWRRQALGDVRSAKHSMCTTPGQCRGRITSLRGASEDSPEGEVFKQISRESGNWSYQTHLCPNKMAWRARDIHRTQASNLPPTPSSLLWGTLMGGLSVLDSPSECEEGRNCPRLEW